MEYTTIPVPNVSTTQLSKVVNYISLTLNSRIKFYLITNI